MGKIEMKREGPDSSEMAEWLIRNHLRTPANVLRIWRSVKGTRSFPRCS
ncbi:MAG: hypothetical protein ABIF01_01555 [Candidatus Micrarchaeota archaeon]